MRISDWSSDVCSSDLLAWRVWRVIERMSGEVGQMPSACEAQHSVVRVHEGDLGSLRLIIRRLKGHAWGGLDRGKEGNITDARSRGDRKESREGQEVVGKCRSWWEPWI